MLWICVQDKKSRDGEKPGFFLKSRFPTPEKAGFLAHSPLPDLLIITLFGEALPVNVNVILELERELECSLVGKFKFTFTFKYKFTFKFEFNASPKSVIISRFIEETNDAFV